jgi:hypothetical protein
VNDESVIATQARSLIAQLQQEQKQKSRELQREAEDWSRAQLLDARRKARARVGDAVHLARERHRREIAATAAAIDAERRRQQQAQLADLVADVIARLPEQLAARWRDDDARRRWLEATLAAAESRLGISAWTIRYAPGLPSAEMTERRGDATMTWREDPDLVAGLVIEKPGARMDASVAGLLADSTELQSRILFLLDESTRRSLTYE